MGIILKLHPPATIECLLLWGGNEAYGMNPIQPTLPFVLGIKYSRQLKYIFFSMISFSIYISFFEISLKIFIYLNSKYRDEQISILTRRQTRITEHLGSWWQKCIGNLASRFKFAIITFSSSHSSRMRQWTGMGRGVLGGLKKLLSLLIPIWNSLIYNSSHSWPKTNLLGLLETSSEKQKKKNKTWVLQLNKLLLI